jgi:hypothetical protein
VRLTAGAPHALDAGMTRALDINRADPAVPVLLESTNPTAFCAGADLTVPDRERAEVSDLLYQCYEAMVTRPGLLSRWSRGHCRGGAQLAGPRTCASPGRAGGSLSHPSAGTWRWGPGFCRTLSAGAPP